MSGLEELQALKASLVTLATSCDPVVKLKTANETVGSSKINTVIHRDYYENKEIWIPLKLPSNHECIIEEKLISIWQCFQKILLEKYNLKSTFSFS